MQEDCGQQDPGKSVAAPAGHLPSRPRRAHLPKSRCRWLRSPIPPSSTLQPEQVVGGLAISESAAAAAAAAAPGSGWHVHLAPCRRLQQRRLACWLALGCGVCPTPASRPVSCQPPQPCVGSATPTHRQAHRCQSQLGRAAWRQLHIACTLAQQALSAPCGWRRVSAALSAVAQVRTTADVQVHNILLVEAPARRTALSRASSKLSSQQKP